MIDYLEQRLGVNHGDDIDLIVATHPHADHIQGIQKLLERYNCKQFWDSGFRHNSDDWINLMNQIEKEQKRNDFSFIRPTAGMIAKIGGIQVTVIAPSIALRNRYDTYGVNLNNSSIVLKIEYNEKSILLAGDAQWDSWARVTEDFPHFEKTEDPDQKVKVSDTYNPLKCHMIKVSHHASKHGTSLEYIERLSPNFAAVSCGTLHNCPHQLTKDILKEKKVKTSFTTNGSIIYAIDKSVMCYQSKDGVKDIPKLDSFIKRTSIHFDI